ncbi:Uncharacterized protein TCM_031178 [Theobroma cacao]|uniref:Uncharacterized protein n=1 Tax=Theobroma cacao TaxID=3641 RepID=A0A061F7N6_THECC|nr:Uncharacterized protein TCM_031178 [Theobroma cacao]
MGGGVIRAAAKVAGLGVVNTGLRAGFQVSPSSTEHSVMRVASRPVSSAMAVSSGGVSSVADAAASVNQKVGWETFDDWEFAGGVEEEVAMVGSTASGGGEPMARVLFGGVPSHEEAKEATADLKDALDKVYLSSPNSADTAQACPLTLLSYPEETKDCVACNVKATSVPKPAIQAFKLFNESPQVQTSRRVSFLDSCALGNVRCVFAIISCPPVGFLHIVSVVTSLAADQNVWNAVLNNSAYMEFVQSQKTNDELEDHGSPRSSESSVKLEEYVDASHPKDSGNQFSNFLLKVKTTVIELVNKATDFLQSLFTLPSAENAEGNAGSTFSSFDKTIGASLMGLAVMVIMVVLVKRA